MSPFGDPVDDDAVLADDRIVEELAPDAAIRRDLLLAGLTRDQQ